jgi:hypothetical protein
MAVHPELVREHLVAPLHARAMSLMKELSPEALEQGWEEARRALAPEVGRNEDADRLARSLARAGYAAREAELERFEPARGEVDWLLDEISARIDRGQDPAVARRSVCVERALTEPDARPSPESGAASWRVPGPGAHVRHLLALDAADELAPKGERPPSGVDRPRDVKRCWLYGFLMRTAAEVSDA